MRFYVFNRYFTPEMGAILLVNEALRVQTYLANKCDSDSDSDSDLVKYVDYKQGPGHG